MRYFLTFLRYPLFFSFSGEFVFVFKGSDFAGAAQYTGVLYNLKHTRPGKGGGFTWMWQRSRRAE